MSAPVSLSAVLSAEMAPLRRCALSLTRAPDQADDLVQDVCMAAHRFWSSYDHRGQPGAWLRTIARNLHLNRIRADRSRGAAFDAAATQPDALGYGDSGTPEAALASKAECERIHAAIASLPENYRAIVEAVDVEGLSYAEAAERFGWPMGTVMSRLHRGRRRLESVLA